MDNKNNDYWVGLYGIRIPNSIKSVIAEDCCNTLYFDGSGTELFSLNAPLSETEYKNKYAEFNTEDGFWYWKTKDSMENDYWLGPYDIRVPNSIKFVTASDGYNTLFSDGNETEIFRPNAPTLSEDEYKNKYAQFNAKDGYWYWKS